MVGKNHCLTFSDVHVASTSVHVSRKSISGQWPLLLQSHRPTSDQLVLHSRWRRWSWSSGLLLRLTNGLAVVSTKGRKREVRKMVLFSAGIGVTLMMCVAKLLALKCLPPLGKSQSGVERRGGGRRRQLFRICFCHICFWVTDAWLLQDFLT